MKDFIERIRIAMEDSFGDDRRRIEHAHRVARFARELLDEIDADVTITMAAAFLHDIGIHEAERRHGSSAGPYQEIEGPPIVRKILEGLGAKEEVIGEVCTLVGRHHTPGGVDSPEFRILWDADALVNLEEVVPGKAPEKIRSIIERWMVTEGGRRRALGRYLAEDSPVEEGRRS